MVKDQSSLDPSQGLCHTQNSDKVKEKYSIVLYFHSDLLLPF